VKARNPEMDEEINKVEKQRQEIAILSIALGIFLLTHYLLRLL